MSLEAEGEEEGAAAELSTYGLTSQEPICGVVPAVIIEQVVQPGLQLDPPADAPGKVEIQHDHLLRQVGGDPGAVVLPSEGHREWVGGGIGCLERMSHAV